MATVVYTTVTGTSTGAGDAPIDWSTEAGNFSYLRKSHVKVRISGPADTLDIFKASLKTGIDPLTQNTDYTIDSVGDITFLAVADLDDGVEYQVEVRRNSNIDERYVDFIDGAVVTEANLDNAQKQQLYISQELNTKMAEQHEDGSIGTAGVTTFAGTFSGTIGPNSVGTTQSASDNSTKIATTAYVDAQTGLDDTIAELLDTTITSPTDGSLLLYDTGTSKWRDGAMSGDATISDTGAITVATLNQDTTGNAATATALETARTIGGTSFDGTGNIVPATITVADTTDTSCSVGLFESATGDLAPKSDGGITYNAGTGTLTATALSGPLTGNVTGSVTGNVTGNLTGDVTGDVTGDLTGDVTGDLTGDVTGNCSGTAATVTGAAQTAITSVGTLTDLTVSGTSTTIGTVTSGIWQGTAVDGTYIDLEGAELKSTGESGGTKYLREDGDGSCSWQAVSASGVEGTAVLSTGETGATKFLREDGDGTCSWVVPSGSGDVSKVGTPVSGQVGYWTGDGTLAGETNLFWDATNDRLGIGTDSPSYSLVVGGGGNTQLQIKAGSASYSSLYFGDADLGYIGIIQYNHADNSMEFYTGNSAGTSYVQALHIDSSQRVGIGTAVPNARLTVSDSSSSTAAANHEAGIRISNTDTTANNWASVVFDSAAVAAGDMSLQFTDHTNNYGELTFSTRGTDGYYERMRIDSAGLVGIGTAVPSKKLHISGTTGDNSRMRFTDTDNSTSFDVGVDASGGLLSSIGANGLLMYTNGSLAMTVDSSQRIGIGGTPTGLLHLTKATDPSLMLTNTTGNQSYYIAVDDSATDKPLVIGNGTAVGTNTRIALNPSSGNVGIGTDSPSYPLEVVSGTANYAALGDATSTSGASALHLLAATNKTNWSIGANYNVADGFNITPSTASGGSTFTTPALTILNSGLVGIGGTPSHKLTAIDATVTAGFVDVIGVNCSTSTGNTAILGYEASGSAPTHSVLRSANNLPLAFVTNNTPVKRMIIDENGSIDLVASKLTIGGGNGNDGDVLTSDGAGNIAWEAGGGSGDITGVDLTGGTGISIDSELNTTSGDYSATITCDLEGTEVKSSGPVTDGHVLTADGVGGAAWEALPAAGAVLQIVTMTPIDATSFNSSTTTYTDITDLTLDIEPLSATSKILVEVQVTYGGATNLTAGFRVTRDVDLSGSPTVLNVSSQAASGAQNCCAALYVSSSQNCYTDTFKDVDDSHGSTPGSTTLTYQVQVATRSTSYGFVLNKPWDDVDDSSEFFGLSSITLTEIAVAS